VLWRRADELPAEPEALRAWTFGIAKGVLANQRRGEVRRNDLTERLRGEMAVQAPPTDENASATFAALATLRATDRELVTLIIWDGFGVAEAGALLGLSPGAARTRYSRARSQLRRQLN
jgi:DNA-directed RNA polymerase specialized sigma24 family protein